ncbi:hypothetical protein R3P38DRAFT_3242191 [Favolaschia claudopus]|uniref:Uncharacterized protein n=1 Tax=Favolaschia claudopus TaxID=2862362 RepID=A0AAV9Z5D7_9AGAR
MPALALLSPFACARSFLIVWLVPWHQSSLRSLPHRDPHFRTPPFLRLPAFPECRSAADGVRAASVVQADRRARRKQASRVAKALGKVQQQACNITGALRTTATDVLDFSSPYTFAPTAPPTMPPPALPPSRRPTPLVSPSSAATASLDFIALQSITSSIRKKTATYEAIHSSGSDCSRVA